MILCTGKPKTHPKKLIDLINEICTVASYKSNIQKSVAFLYRNNKISEKVIKISIPFTVSSKTLKYLGINFTKQVKDLYIENYRTLMKEIKDTNTWKGRLCSRIGRIWLKCLYH